MRHEAGVEGGMNLPFDVSLCHGNGSPVCEDCARRLANSEGLRWWVEPLADGDVCELKIEAEVAA